jgi:hypothetical protein
MALATWGRSDPLPQIPALTGFYAAIASDDVLLAQLNRLSLQEVQARRLHGHRPYIGYFHSTPVSYGWLATRVATIGEVGLTIALPHAQRYLWDFATLPAWRGRGLYPRLLQVNLRAESGEAERFWIIYAPENLPSGAGMRKAGFAPAAELSFDAQHQVRRAPLGTHEQAQAAAGLLGLPIVGEQLSPCWHCQTTSDTSTIASCWPPGERTATACSCTQESI